MSKKMTNAERIAAMSKKYGKELRPMSGKYGWPQVGRVVDKEGPMHPETHVEIYTTPYTDENGKLQWNVKVVALYAKEQTITLEQAKARNKAAKKGGQKAPKKTTAKENAPKKNAPKATPKADAPKAKADVPKATPKPNAKKTRKSAVNVSEAKPATVYRTAEFSVLGEGVVKGYAITVGSMKMGVYKVGNVWKAAMMNGLPVALEARTRTALVEMLSVAL